MKLKNMWKRFWTLDVHNHEGFTLVELIIVIAILAILSTGAIAGYSAYVERANMAADKALVADIVNVLTLAYYSNELNDSGFVVLYEDADPAFNEGSAAVNALNVAYNNNLSGLQLQYNGWTDTATMLTSLKKVGDYAGSINSSGFIKDIGTEKVLQDVQHCATSFAQFVKKMQEAGSTTADAVQMLKSNMDTDDEAIVDTLLAAAGYTADNGYAGLSHETLSNIVVFAVADKVAGSATKQQATVAGFADGSYLQKVKPGSKLVDVANFYAAGEALVAYLNDPACNAYFSGGTVDGEQVGINMTGTAFEIVLSMMGAYELIGTRVQEDSALQLKLEKYYDTTSGKSQAQIDGEAYVAVMSTVNDLREDYLKDSDAITNNKLFTEGGLLPRVDTFLLLADKVDELEGLLASGQSAIVIAYGVKNGQFVCDVAPSDVLG